MRPSNEQIAPARILVANGNSDTAESMAFLLRFRGHEVRTITAVRQTIDLARQEQPSCVILYITAFSLEVHEIAAQLRRESMRPFVLIGVSDGDCEDDVDSMQQADFDHFCLNPIDREGLEALLNLVDHEMQGRIDLGAPSEPGSRKAESSPRTSLRHVEVSDPLGLHLRPASLFAALAQRFRSDVRVHRDGRCANGKSILDLATLAAACGDRLRLEAEGPDADEALDALTQIFSFPCIKID